VVWHAARDRPLAQIVDVVAEQEAPRVAGRHRDLRHVLGMNCRAWSALTSAPLKKRCISAAEIAQAACRQ